MPTSPSSPSAESGSRSGSPAVHLPFADDRIRTAFDIEAIVGLPVVARLPLLGPEKTAAAFAALFESWSRRPEFRRARRFLNTSSIPGEGKSFVTFNLARAAARHHRVVILDCDFYRPTAHEAFGVARSPGLAEFCAERASLDQIIHRNVAEGLDLIGNGAGGVRPEEIVNGRVFQTLLTTLGERYERVYLDAPPMVVPDVVAPLVAQVEAWTYTVYWNKTKRTEAARAAKQLLRISTPCVGAVLNGAGQTGERG